MKQVSLTILLLFIANVVNGQNQLQSTTASSSYEEVNIPKLVPVSPNAAALGIFGSIPVGHYTGVPNISIPIHEIDLDGKKFPVNISYHASGIKVAQEASTVGLGWALNAGGCITKEVRGWDDFRPTPTGYYFDTMLPKPDANNNLDTTTADDDRWKYELYIGNQSDPEPDLFHFNFASFSGSMFFNKYTASGNSASIAKAIIQKETACLDATFYISGNNSSWIISDGDGFRYYFNTHESSEMFTSQTDFFIKVKPREEISPRSTQQEIVTAWYLDSIVSPNHNKIIFSYEKERVYSPLSVSEDVSYMLDMHSERLQEEGDDYITTKLEGAYKYYNYSYAKTEQSLLTGISFPGGQISFHFSDRLDLESTDKTKKAKKLVSIIISNKNENVKNIALKHSYLGITNDPLTCRLMLDTLKIHNKNDVLNYSLSYNRNGGGLPSKNSLSSDYWGYYNSSSVPVENTSFKLTPSFIATSDKGSQYIPGLDKQSKEYDMKYGILTSIQYPTGGKTTFDYEKHTFQNTFDTFEKEILMQHEYSFDEGESEKSSADFVISKETETTIDLSCYSFSEKERNILVYIEQKQNNTYKLVKTDYFNYNPTTTSTTFNYKFSNPGIYRIRLVITGNGGVIYVVVNGIIPKIVNSGGGLRIKTITDETDNAPFIKREFSYKKNDNSTGILMTIPQYHSYYVLASQVFHTEQGYVLNIMYTALYINGFSTPYTPFGNSAMGGNIGYSYVEEKMTDTTNNNGWVAYTFVNQADSLVDLSDRFIKGYPSIPHLNNGTPLDVCYFDKDMHMKKKETFEYAKKKTSSVKGLKMFRAPMATGGMYIKFYDLYSERRTLDKKIDSLFFANQHITSTTEYQYNNYNWLVNSEKTYDSKNETIERKIKYPNDFTAIEPYVTMVNQKILYPVVEQSSYKNNQFLEKAATDYKNWGNGVFAPEFVKLQTNGQSVPETRITYYNYDSHGNPLHINKDGMEKVVYLWGYSYQHPIAEIKNTTYEQVRSVLGDDLINRVAQAYTPSGSDLATINTTLRALSNVQVTTYTYKPLVGIETVTDSRGVISYYVYDSLGRLKETYYYEENDPNKKRVIETYDYRYRN